MPRLPVSGAPAGKADSPTIVVSWWGMLLAIGVLTLSIAGDVLLVEWLGLDLDCLEGKQRRRSAAVEAVICSAAAGPKGWFYLAWLAAPLVLFAWWLGRSLRRTR